MFAKKPRHFTAAVNAVVYSQQIKNRNLFSYWIYQQKQIRFWIKTLHKKWSFSLRISSVNATKSAGNCGFGHIYWRNP